MPECYALPWQRATAGGAGHWWARVDNALIVIMAVFLVLVVILRLLNPTPPPV